MSGVEGLRRKATGTRPGEQSINELDGQYFNRAVTSTPLVDNSINIGSGGARLAAIYAVTHYGTSTSALYADLAERYKTDCEVKPGDVVKLGGAEEITLSDKYMDADIFGVVSTNPAILMNDHHDEEMQIGPPVGLAGRVPCRVIGKVKKGQYLVSSNVKGHAEAIELKHLDEAWKLLCIIGRALEDKDTNESGLVEIVLGK